STDNSGQYVLRDIEENAILVFMYMGKQSQEVSITGRTRVNVVLEESSSTIEEVVAIGYGTARRKDLTGSVVSINAEKLKNIPTTSHEKVFVGRMLVLNVSFKKRTKNADIKGCVRGKIFITYDNSPLYIVDGFRIANINDIPMTDIETIDVLKDAASTAIY